MKDSVHNALIDLEEQEQGFVVSATAKTAARQVHVDVGNVIHTLEKR